MWDYIDDYLGENVRRPYQSVCDPLGNTKSYRFSSKFHKIHRRTPVLESLFNKVAGLKACNFIKNRLQHGCFVKFANLLRTSFFKEHLRWLLLEQHHTNVSFENFQILGNGHSDFRKWTFSK